MDPKTIQTYDQLAKEYDEETADFWERFPSSIIDTFVAQTHIGKILDVGSGPGRDGLILKEAGCDVLCLDASETMVALCKEKGLEAIRGDFMKLPFENSAFDGVWAYTSLLHIPKASLPDALTEIFRVLKLGAVLGLGLIEGIGEEYKLSAGVDKQRYFAYYERSEVEDVLKKSGFDTVYFSSFKPKTRNYLNYIFKKQTE